MRKMNRWGLLLALPTMFLLGCEGVTTTGTTLQPATEIASAETSRMRAIVSVPRQLQSTAGIEVLLEVAYSGWEYRNVVVEPRVLQLDEPTVIANLVPGPVTVTVTARDAETHAMHDRQQMAVVLLPGEETPVSFSLLHGGKPALDLGVSFGQRLLDYRRLSHADGFDSDFAAYYPNQQQLLFWLTRDSQRVAVTFQVQYSTVYRRIGAGVSESYPTDSWTAIPTHAVYVDSELLAPSTKVRHYRWTNQYPGDAQTWTEVTVDRWYGASEGLLKEVISDENGVVSTLMREGVVFEGGGVVAND